MRILLVEDDAALAQAVVAYLRGKPYVIAVSYTHLTLPTKA